MIKSNKLDVNATLKVAVILPALIKNKRMAQWSSWPRSTRHNYDFH